MHGDKGIKIWQFLLCCLFGGCCILGQVSCLHCILEQRLWMSHVENAAAINPAVFRILDYIFASV